MLNYAVKEADAPSAHVSLSDDTNLEVRGHLWVQVDNHRVVANNLDGVSDDDAAAVDGLVELSLDCVSDLSARHSTEEAASL